MLKRHEIKVLLKAGHTQSEVAKLAGVSLRSVKRVVKEGDIERVDDAAERFERGIGRPSLVQDFRKPVTELLEEGGAPAPRVVRAAERRSLVDAETGVERHGLSPELLRHGLDLVWYLVPAGETVGAMVANRAGILEHLTVVRGTLTLLLGRERHRLRAGDGITYGPQATVEYRNEGRGPCEFMLVADTRRAS